MTRPSRRCGPVFQVPGCPDERSSGAIRFWMITSASSNGRRNTCLQSTCRSLETQCLSGTLIQAPRDLVELRLRDVG